MRYVRVPENLPITIDETCPLCQSLVVKLHESPQSWTLPRYLKNVVLRDPTFGTGYDALIARQEIESQFEEASPGDWVNVVDAHWKTLTSAIQQPQGAGIPNQILVQFLPFMEAVLEAKSTKPDAQSDLVQPD